MTANDSNNISTWDHFHFGLIVTGIGERKYLTNLFKTLSSTGFCSFKVIHFMGQRTPITSEKKIIKMVGNGKIIPDKDQAIGLKARLFLDRDSHRFVILIDDLEHARESIAKDVFGRYRLALDTILTDEQLHRASVHFLVNMLEAYYFADADAVNSVLKSASPFNDYEGDVETIRHPKNKLKELFPGFDEVKDGGEILERLDVEHVLSRCDTCCWLRTLFEWCVEIIKRHSYYGILSPSPSDKYCLKDGKFNDITRQQLNSVKQL